MKIPKRGLMLNKHPIEISHGTEIGINGNKNDITPGLQKVITDKTYKTAKAMI